MRLKKFGKSLKKLKITKKIRNYFRLKLNKQVPAAKIAGIFAVFLLVSSSLFANASLTGLTGTMLVPGLEILPPGGARAAIHMTGKSDFEDASFKGVFAFSDDSEVAVVKRFGLSGVVEDTDPVFAGKYKVRPNMAVAAIIDPNDGKKDSVMLLTGMPGNRVVLGLGTNIAMNEREKIASFGRYNEQGTEVDPVFFIFGASVNIDADTKLTLDYAGNDFCVGVRHSLDESIVLDFGFLPPDRIHNESRYLIGANFGF
jgi:hypothetical protein